MEWEGVETRRVLYKMEKFYRIACLKLDKIAVVPHAGTWIEIMVKSILSSTTSVVPHAGTWIEIVQQRPRP